MHRVPAGACFKFNYDFIGTDQYPIENLNEQLFLTLALACENDASVPFDLSPNMFRLYDTAFEIAFEHKPDLRVNYLSFPNENGSKLNRFITSLSSDNFFAMIDNKPVVNDVLMYRSSDAVVKPFEVNVDCIVERLTITLNDDYMSEVC